jgi:type IV pilus assembly protein PilW
MKLRNRQAGLSLIELMVSITLGLMILSGVLVVFANSSAARNEVERTSRQIENGRFASDLLSEDIRLAGFYGELNAGSVGAPGGAWPNDPCSLAKADWTAWVPLHIQGFYQDQFPAPSTCAFANRKAGSDVLLIRRARACVAGVGSCEATANGKAYVTVSLCATETATTYQMGIWGTDTFDRHKKNCVTAPPGTLADKREYYVHIYYLSTTNGAGDNIPTLMRLELTGAGWNAVPLVEGIEEFHLQYGIDNNSDGNPDVYVADPNTAAVPGLGSAAANWMNVVTVQFNLLARNLEPSLNYSDVGKTYSLGNDAAGNPITVAGTGSYRRHVYQGLVRVANVSGRRDAP